MLLPTLAPPNAATNPYTTQCCHQTLHHPMLPPTLAPPNAAANQCCRPTNYLGKFSSDDPGLDRIWNTGAYTVKVTEVGNGAYIGFWHCPPS